MSFNWQVSNSTFSRYEDVRSAPVSLQSLKTILLNEDFSKLNETLHIAGTLQTLLGKEAVLSFQGMMVAEEA